jgi:dTDP-4-amino-4,6-dideoxygalactose transaminase
MVSPLHRQLPVYSPLALADIWCSAKHASLARADPRTQVSELLRNEYQADHAVPCGSGTQALQLALQIASRSIGEKLAVALPAFTCFDVATAAVGSGARITLYDVDPGSLGPDFDSLQRVLADGVRVVVVSPLYGVPIDWASLEECSAPYEAIVIEDAAQGHGATWRSRPLGSLSELGVLSFARGKGWTGLRGGALLIRQRPTGETEAASCKPGAAAELAVLLSALAQWALGRPALYAVPAAIPWLGLGETKYRDPSPPETMTRSAAALLCGSFQASMLEASFRRSYARSLLESIPFGARVRAVRPDADGVPGYLRLPLRLSRGLAGFPDPEEATRLGVAASYPGTLAVLQPVRARMTQRYSHWPGGEELSRELVTLATHSRVNAGEQARVLRLLNDYPA